MIRNQLLLYLLLNLFWIPCSSQWSHTSISTAKAQMGATFHGNQIFLAGGSNGISFSPRVDVYHITNNEWSTLNMMEARALPAAVTLNDEIIFAGGYNVNTSSTVDIFNAFTFAHTAYNLSRPRLSIAVVTNEDIAMFAGGATIEDFKVSNRIDIYDQSTHTWSIDSLSQARAAMGFGVLNNKAYFAGGYLLNNQVSDRIDIYNFETKSWETASLSQPRGFLSAVVVGTQIIFAGGMTNDIQPSDQVDIYDTATQLWTTSKLSVARAFIDNGASICDKAFFVGGCYLDFANNSSYHPFKIVDIYDPATQSWTQDSLPEVILGNAVTSTGHYWVSAGGATNLQFPMSYSPKVNIYRCTPLSSDFLQEKRIYPYPNPSTGVFAMINDHLSYSDSLSIQIYDSFGKSYLNQRLNQNQEIDLSNCPNGLYYLLITGNNGQVSIKKSIMIIH